ncbi:hypothetical protein QJQ45_022658 [Haematococcus lacustris]|nr:hypothetical protein QJQ45_022658 [Haematococcus lacustris]
MDTTSSWAQQRSRIKEAASVYSQRRQSGSTSGVGALLVASVAAAGWWWWSRRKQRKPPLAWHTIACHVTRLACCLSVPGPCVAAGTGAKELTPTLPGRAPALLTCRGASRASRTPGTSSLKYDADKEQWVAKATKFESKKGKVIMTKSTQVSRDLVASQPPGPRS